MNAALPVTRVYLVEDSPILTKLLIGLLEAESQVVVVGHSDVATTAIEDIANLQPDAVIVDLHLRIGSGVDVIRGVLGSGARPVFMVLTNHSSPPYRKAAMAAGAQHFFDKSTEIPLMLSRIRALPKAIRAPK